MQALKQAPSTYLSPFLLASLLLVPACGDDAGDTGDEVGTTDGADMDTDTDTGVADGRDFYDGEASAALGADGNQARCSTCHSDDGTLTGFSGKTMKDIAFKENFKGGGADLLGAANACITGWMSGPALTADDPSYVALAAFLESISDPSVTTPNTIAPEVLADEAEYEAMYAGGDAAAGAAKYDTFCAKCHGGGLVVGQIPAYPKASLSGYTIGRIAQKVRTSGPPPSGTNDAADTTPGPMPFFEAEELPAADLADIIAHLKG